MPLYEIHHTAPLTPSQQHRLASAITSLHCTTFSAPSLFVNTTFHPTPTVQKTFVGGHPASTNYILGHLRPRPDNAQNLGRIVHGLTELWNIHARPEDSVSDKVKEVVGLGYNAKEGDGRLDDERALHNVFLMEDIAAGSEQGFVLPRAGEDGEWVTEHMGEFERRAGEGDEGMGRLVREIKAKL